MTSTTTAPSSVEDARAALHEAERELSSLTAAAVEGLDAPTGATYAAAEGAVAVARHRLRGAQDREVTGETSRGRSIAEEIAAGYAEQDRQRAIRDDELRALGALSAPGVAFQAKQRPGDEDLFA